MGEVGPVDTLRHTFPHTFPSLSLTATSSQDPGGSIQTGTTNPGGAFSSASDPNTSSTDTTSLLTDTDSATSSNPSPSPTDPSTSPMTTSAPPSSSSTGVPANSGSSTGSNPVSTTSKHGLSGGSVAGVVIGLLALLGLLTVLFIFLRRRRAARNGTNNRSFLSFGGSPRSGDGRADAYTEPKPRSRPSSRFVVPAASSTPFVPTSTDLLPRHNHNSTQSVGTVASDIARTYESHGTLAGVGGEEGDYLEKLEDAEASVGLSGSMTSGTTLTHSDSPFLPYDAPALPSQSKARDTKNRRSTGDAMVITDHNYNRYTEESAIPRQRSKSQDLVRGGDVTPPSPTTYPPVPTPSLSSAPSTRKVPRKKPVPRYSEEASRAKTSAPSHRRDGSTTPPATASPGVPREFEGKEVHYLIPDMPAPQR